MNNSTRMLAFLLLMLCAQSAFATGTVRRFALAAGANTGGSGRTPLRYAVSDAENFVQVLETMGGVDPSNRILLWEPDLQAFHRALEELRRKVSAAPKGDGRTEVLFYYSGHADEDGLLLGEERFSYRSLRDKMDTIQADVHITVLDACASGAITRLKGGQRKKAFLVDASSDMKGYAFLTSSSGGEAAQESDRIRASFFTHYLVSGLRGAADVSGDGKVTLGEAYQFAFHETLAHTARTQGGPQHPAYDINLVGTGDVVMTDVRQTSAGLVLGEALNGRFFVRNVDGQLVAELYKPAGRSVELGLEPGTYAIHFEREPRFFTSSIDLEEGQRLVLEETHFQPVPGEQTAQRGKSEGGDGIRVELNEPQLSMDIDDRYTVSLGFFYNYKKNPFLGVQLSVFANLAKERAGSQVSSLGNLGRKDIRGGQFSGIANFAGGNVSSVQFAGVLNAAGDTVRIIQVAGVLNAAKRVENGQIAGVVNLAGEVGGFQVGVLNIAARKVEGIQIGVANIASEVKGIQIGVANISRDIEGVPIGLFNYSHTGLFDLSFWTDETGLSYVTLMSGSRNFYSAWSAGYRGYSDDRLFAFGLGMGGHFERNAKYVDIDVNQYTIFGDLPDHEPDNYLTRLRVSGGVKLGSHASLFAGVSLNHLWTGDDEALISPWGGYEKNDDSGKYAMWPGFFGGIRFSR